MSSIFGAEEEFEDEEDESYGYGRRGLGQRRRIESSRALNLDI